MIKTIYNQLHEYLKGQEDVALEIRMHPSVLGDCIDCDYHEVITAFNMTPQRPSPTKMFNYRLVVDFDFDEGEWYVQTPRV